MELNPNEKILKKGRANHLKSFEGVGGELILTNKRLYFESHKFNIQIHDDSIFLEDIASIQIKHSNFISKKIEILLKNGLTESYIVNNRRSWFEEIQAAVEVKMKSIGKNWENVICTDFDDPPGGFLKLIMAAILYIMIGLIVGILIYTFLNFKN